MPFAAGEVSIGCAAEALDRVELRVVDPTDELKAARDPVAFARRYLRGKGLNQTDLVDRAVSIANEFPVVRVVRGGRVVAKVVFDSIGPNYLSGTVEMCADFA